MKLSKSVLNRKFDTLSNITDSKCWRRPFLEPFSKILICLRITWRSFKM